MSHRIPDLDRFPSEIQAELIALYVRLRQIYKREDYWNDAGLTAERHEICDRLHELKYADTLRDSRREAA